MGDMGGNNKTAGKDLEGKGNKEQGAEMSSMDRQRDDGLTSPAQDQEELWVVSVSSTWFNIPLSQIESVYCLCHHLVLCFFVVFL